MRYLILVLCSAVLFVFLWRPFTTGSLGDPISYLYYSPCDRVVTYRVGEIDPRYDLDASELIPFLSEAAGHWNEAAGKQILRYDSNGTVTVNMPYDSRQELGTEVVSRESTLKNDKTVIDRKEQQYLEDVDALQKRIADFKQRADEWNRQGGAPSDIYEKLLSEQQSIKAEVDRLNQVADQLNMSSATFNARVTEFRNLVSDFSDEIRLRPEEGQYDRGSRRIDVFFYTSRDDLLHTLVHEFGHAVGIGHVDDPQSVMYLYSNKIIIPTSVDKRALDEVCRRRPLHEIAAQRMGKIIEYFGQLLTARVESDSEAVQ